MMDAVHVGGLGGTFGGNPLACAVALAAIETVRAARLLERAAQIERLMLPCLRRLQAEDARFGDVRGRGAMIAVELVQPGTNRPDPDLTKRVATAAHGQGVILLTCGTDGNVLRLLPPLAITDELLVGVLAAALSSTDERPRGRQLDQETVS